MAKLSSIKDAVKKGAGATKQAAQLANTTRKTVTKVKGQVAEIREKGVVGTAKDKVKKMASKKARKAARQAAGHALRAIGTFLITPPLGWIATLFLVMTLVGIGNATAADKTDMGELSEFSLVDDNDKNGDKDVDVEEGTDDTDDEDVDSRRVTDKEAAAMNVACVVGADYTGTAGSVELGEGKDDWKEAEVLKFLSSSVGSTWGIKPEDAAAYFLDQAAKNPSTTGRVTAKYNLTKANIGKVTQAVAKEGMSPVLFYLYAVNEGGGEGGFINNRTRENEYGDAVKDAAADAKKFVETATNEGGHPATEKMNVRMGVPSLPTMDTTFTSKLLKSLAPKTMGRAYLQMTAAATGEVEQLHGQVVEGMKGHGHAGWAGGESGYGYPISQIMTAISKLPGGDPTKGDVIGTVDGGTEGQEGLCATPSHGDTSDIISTAKSLLGYFTYSQGNRMDLAKSGKAESIQSLSDVKKTGQADCSSFVWLVLKLSGHDTPKGGWTTVTLEDFGKKKKYVKTIDKKEAKAGDIIIMNVNGGQGSNGHAAILQEAWKGDNTKIIQMGGGNKEGVNEGTFGDSFTSLTAAGGKPIFLTPVK